MYHKVRHTIKLLKGKELEIRNSPLNLLATKLARAFLCVKGICDTTVTFGGLLSLGTFYDAVLLGAGAEPVFIPKISEIIFPNTTYQEHLRIQLDRITKIREMAALEKDSALLEEASIQIKAINMEEPAKSEILEAIKEAKSLNQSEKDKVVALILEGLKEKEK